MYPEYPKQMEGLSVSHLLAIGNGCVLGVKIKGYFIKFKLIN